MTRTVSLIGAAVLLATTTLAPTPVLAQSATPPEGCEAFLTVQFKGCLASIYWRCPAAPEGITWEGSFDENGPISVATFNREFEWLDTFFFFDGSRERLSPEGERPASLTELLETGENEYDFVTLETGPEGQKKTRYRGVDRLTGETVTIGDEELLVTEFATVALDAETEEIKHTTHGRQFVLEDERLFLLGTDAWLEDGTTTDTDYSPVDILRPGDPGFGKTRPLYECGAVDL